MTPAERSAILETIAKLLDAGKTPRSIYGLLTQQGIDPSIVKELLVAASADTAVVYHHPAPGAWSGWWLLVAALLLVACSFGIIWINAPRPHRIEIDNYSQDPRPVWPTAADEQEEVPFQNTYDYVAGDRMEYGIIRYHCNNGGSYDFSDRDLMEIALSHARARFQFGYQASNGYPDGPGIFIRQHDGTRKKLWLPYVHVLLDDATKGGAYCGAIISAGAALNIFQPWQTSVNESDIVYASACNVISLVDNSTERPRYYLVEQEEAEYRRRLEESQRQLADEQIMAIGNEAIDGWLRDNGYEVHEMEWVQQDIYKMPSRWSFRVDADLSVLGIEKTAPLFSVQVDCQSGETKMSLERDCAEFLRLARARVDSVQAMDAKNAGP